MDPLVHSTTVTIVGKLLVLCIILNRFANNENTTLYLDTFEAKFLYYLRPSLNPYYTFHH